MRRQHSSTFRSLQSKSIPHNWRGTQIEAAIRLEPGVLVLYSVSNKDNPARVTVLEIYRDRDAYLAHLQAPHFLKYKATVEKMVKSLKLVLMEPIMLGAKVK